MLRTADVYCIELKNSQTLALREKYLNTGKYGPKKTPYLDTFHSVGHNFDNSTWPQNSED